MLELKLPVEKVVYECGIEDSHRANKGSYDNPLHADHTGNLIMSLCIFQCWKVLTTVFFLVVLCTSS